MSNKDIRDSTRTVCATGVSPESFLAYAASENRADNGSGWINHFRKEVNTVTPAAMAKKDCE
ncbi:hypothetical protein FACS189472_17510 [Alphaproteobacteria bacterium]|nr:hypothetical protein FACS189472_17510 [Alphaproteobacteria bacterium]